MARTPQPFKAGEWVTYGPPAGGSVRVCIVRVYATRTGTRALVLTPDGQEISVRPSQLRRR